MIILNMKLRIIAILVIEMLIKLLCFFPIKKDQIMFISYNGDFSDSPKYIYREFIRRKKKYKYVWAVNRESENEEEISSCKRVRFGSISYLFAVLSSRMVIINNVLFTYIPKRKRQIIINTWHGGSPLKTVGMVNENISEFDSFFYKEHAKKYTVYSSSSRFMTEEVFRKSFAFKGEIFNCGLPRNAILYRNHDAAIGNVSKFFNISVDENNGIILYAPTFRGGWKNAGFIPVERQFDIEKCVSAMEKKFGKKYSFLFRSHYFNSNIPKNCLSATEYPDMQELMAAADILITDYSSCMGDMCLMYKPTFLYVPDLDDYIKERGFYWDIYSLPFPVALDEEDFINKIKSFKQETYIANVDEYLKRLGSYEQPDSDVKFVNYLLNDLLKD